jgi:hypothetical protein
MGWDEYLALGRGTAGVFRGVLGGWWAVGVLMLRFIPPKRLCE